MSWKARDEHRPGGLDGADGVGVVEGGKGFVLRRVEDEVVAVAVVSDRDEDLVLEGVPVEADGDAVRLAEGELPVAPVRPGVGVASFGHFGPPC